MVSTGLRYLIVPVRNGALARARISHRELDVALAAVGAEYAYLLDAEAGEGRHWNNDGVVEDAATGSAAGCVAAYLHRAYATAVREMSTGAGGAGNERAAPAFGCPLMWVCGYRCGTLACGWMSTTHAWCPKSVGMLIAEATLIGVLTAVAAWAGAARPRMAAVSPLATTAANPNLFIVVPSSFYLLLCLSRGAKSRFGGSVGR